MQPPSDDRVSRRRYEREQLARAEAERLLEDKSRELFEANQELSSYSTKLEQAVLDRTAELQRALEKAKAETAVRTRFIATMSHEIRTPLGGLLGMIDLLSMDETDAEKQELLKNAKTSGVALNRIVNDVLDFSKMESGLFVFEREAVDIRSIFEGVIALAGTGLEGRDRVIASQIDPSVPKLFYGDATRVRQVIANLVSNAVRYSSDGPIFVRARAYDHPKGKLLRAEVEDRGVGIAEDKISSLFKDFSQVSNSLTAAAQGTGLGLAISKHIVEGLDGQIGVNSVENAGSTFWFEMPVELVPANDAGAPDGQAAHVAAPEIDLKGHRVLIAEDNKINQKLLTTYARRMGLEAELADNGRIAVEKFEPGKYDLILMDVAMPEMDGLEATRRIKEQWTAQDVPPILILTAHVMAAIQEDAARLGVESVLSKPIPFDELKAAIETVILNRTQSAGPAQQPSGDPALARLTELMSGAVVDGLIEMFTPAELIDLVGEYVADGRGILASMVEHYRAGDATETVAMAHSLKGSSRLLGFEQVGELASAVELNLAEIEEEDMAEIARLMSEQLDQIKAAL